MHRGPFEAAFGEDEDHAVDPEPETALRPTMGERQGQRSIHDEELLSLNPACKPLREALLAPNSTAT